MIRKVRQILYKLLGFIEKIAAHGQGKGYGTATINQEVNLVQSYMGAKPLLAIDVGGNIGNYTFELRRKNPTLEVHIFEPCQTNLAKLKLRFKDDSLVKVVPYALTDKMGVATLFSDRPGSGLASLVKRRLDHFEISLDLMEEINTIRFEDYWQTVLNHQKIDLIKLDIEGYELKALKGLGKALQATKIIQFEFGGCNIDTKTYFQDFWYEFEKQNFEIHRITPFGTQRINCYQEIDEYFLTTNYIAINKN